MGKDLVKYTNLKRIVTELHMAKWFKYVGINEYYKTWKKGELRYTTRLSIEELIYSKQPVQKLLAYADEKAEYELDQEIQRLSQ